MQRTALVLSGRPAAVSAALEGHDVNCVHVCGVDTLIKALVQEVECMGILLDARLVMATPTTQRDRLFTLAVGKPIVRFTMDRKTDRPVFLDPLECLTGACSVDDRNKRLETRTRVRLDALWSVDSDRTMAEPNEAVLLDLSAGGTYMHAPYVLPREDFLNLRILDLADRRPIQCAVRWRKERPGPGRFPGVGLKFMDLTPAQLEEIIERYLKDGDR